MTPVRFDHPRLKWRIIIPARFVATGKRKTEYFKTKEEAETRIKAIELDGRSVVNHFADLSKMIVAKPADLTLHQAVLQWIQWRTGRVGQATLDSDRCRLLKVIYKLGERPISSLTETVLTNFLDQTVNSRSIYKSLSLFFKWAKRQGLVAINPMADLEPIGEFGVNNDYYQPVQFMDLLKKAPTDLLPWLVLSGFAGLRSCEVVRKNRNTDALRVEDITNSYIHIRKEVAKMGCERYIYDPIILEAVKAWFPLFPQPRQGFICPWTARKIKDLRNSRYLKNGGRNSFCTYYLSLKGINYGDLAKVAGNSEAILKKHYASVLPPDTGLRWFGIRP
jgi:hypothetical protein